MDKKTKFVIFGGLGFIGGNLVNLLKDQNFINVIIVERGVEQGTQRRQDNKQLVEGYELISFDNKKDDFSNLHNILRDADVILNLTFPKDFNFDLDKPILDFCEKENRTAKHIFFGSITQYDSSYTTFSDETPQNPLSEYGKIKCKLEELYRSYDLPVIFTRNANVIGYSENFFNKKTFDTILFSNLVNDNKAYFDISDEAYKDFIDGRDFAKIILKLLDTPETIGETFSVGSGKKIYVKEIIELIKQEFPTANVIVDPQKMTDKESFLIDISKLKKFINWEPENSFRDSFLDIKKNILE